LNQAAQPCDYQREALPRCRAKIKQKGKAVPRFLALSLVIFAAAVGAGPALAAETCDQALKDTTAGSKTAIIAPKSTAKVADLIKQAEPLCKGDAQQQAEGIALLRVARSVIGE
jgi:hypothetical protein